MNDHPSLPPPESATIGYVLKMFPRLSETFILNEVLELERHGLKLHIFSLLRPVDQAVHSQARLVRAPISYLPERLRSEPLRIVRALRAVFASHRQSACHALWC